MNLPDWLKTESKNLRLVEPFPIASSILIFSAKLVPKIPLPGKAEEPSPQLEPKQEEVQKLYYK